MISNKVKASAVVAMGLCGAALVSGNVAHADTTHTVQAGETVSELAAQNHTTVDAIASANHLNRDDLIIAGQQITIPGSDNGQASNQQSTTSTYTVQAGDTLVKIASKFNTTVDNLKALNGLSSNLIYVGQTLHVSGQATQAQAQPQQRVVTTTTTTTTTTHYNQNQQAQRQNVAPQQTQTVKAATPAQQASSNQASSGLSGSEQAAKNWIAQHESGGNYNATNGQYIGKYQLSSSYLHGDYSPANQERVANQYVASRYGSWTNAQAHWESCGWY